MSGDRLTIVVKLPASLGAVGELLEVLAANWPGAIVNVESPEGWLITLEARDG